jgi:hypothetical protein
MKHNSRTPRTLDLSPSSAIQPADTAINQVMHAALLLTVLEERQDLWAAARLRDLPILKRSLLNIEQSAIRLRQAHLGGAWFDGKRG